MSYEVQLKWIESLQHALRGPFLDAFFKAFHYVDSASFVYIAITLVWYLWNRRIGAKFFYIILMSATINTVLKNYFHHPRPCQINPLVGIFHLYSPGLPSGAAQSATIYCGLIFFECKKLWARISVVIFALLLCFSRIYLGVHFITDIIGGIGVGCILLLIYYYLFPVLEKYWRFLAIFFPFLFLLGPLFNPPLSHYFYMFFFTTLGVGLGLTSSKRPLLETFNFKVKILRTASVLAGLVALSLISTFYPAVASLICFVQGYWLSYLGAKIIPDKKI